MRECGSAYEEPAILDLISRNTKVTRALEQPELGQIDIRLLAAIEYAMLRVQERPRVLDFGGALGNHYFRLRRFLPVVDSWTVVELPATAAIGAREFADDILTFSTDLVDADIVIASGALQCVAHPHETLEELRARGQFVVVDKYPVYERNRLTVHHVAPSLFGKEVKFPSWFLAPRFTPLMSWRLPGYEAALDGEALDAYHGFVLA